MSPRRRPKSLRSGRARPGGGRGADGEGRLIQLVYYGYVAGSALARWLPERFAYGIANWGGGVWARRSKKKAIVERNLQRITGHPIGSPELDELVAESFRSYARYWLETFRLVRETREFFLERFRTKDVHNLEDPLKEGRGVVAVVGHLGNWDAAGAWVGARGNSLVTVAEVLRPRRMFDFFLAHRARLGMTIYAAEKGVTDKLAAAIEAGAVVAILGDRDLKGMGPEVDFFGEKTTLPAGAASLALRTGVPIVVAGVYGTVWPDAGRGWYCEFSAPLEKPPVDDPNAVALLTERVAEKLEEFIARHPEEWHVLQPFWPSDSRSGRGRPAARRTEP